MTRVCAAFALAWAIAIVTAGPVCAQEGRPSDDARSIVAAAAAAVGTANLRSIRVSGWGSDYAFGQGYDGGSPWPRFHLSRYVVTIDYERAAWREERTRTQGQNPPQGGANQPIVGEQRQDQFLRGDRAWDLNDGRAVPARPERDGRAAVDARQTWLALTPQGFLRAALAGQPRVRRTVVLGKAKAVVSLTTTTGRAIEAVVNEQHLIERVATWIAHPLLGDVKVEAVFRDYQATQGVKYPTHITHRIGAYPVLDVRVTKVEIEPDVAAAFDVPPAITAAPRPAPPIADPTEIAPGVWSIPLGPRDRSVAVAFDSYIVVIEAPESDEISQRGIAAIKRVIPGKPIRYVVNTHTHVDHAGGLRAYAAEGAAIVTASHNVPYYRQILAQPHTIAPDGLARSARTPTVEGLVGARTWTDRQQELIAYHYAGNLHHPGLLFVYLPHARIVIEADSFNPPNDADTPPNALPNLVQFQDVLDRLRLDVEHIVPVHGRITSAEELRRAAETYRETQLWR